MATKYRIQLADEVIEFEGPDNLTDAQIENLADQYLKTAKPGEAFPHAVYEDANQPTDMTGVDEEPVPETTAGGAFLRGLPKDATFNWGDELAAMANAGIPGLAELDNLTGLSGEQQGPLSGGDFWERVKANKAATDQLAAADAEQHPTAEFAGRIGGVLSTLPRIGASVATRLPALIREGAAARPILTTSVLGGTGGAVSGGGAADEGNREQSAAIAGMAGFGLGPATYAAGALVPAIANYAKIFFNKGGEKEAIAQIIKALKRDGFDVETPAGIQKTRAALQEFTGKPVSLADIGGAVRSRTGVGLRAPSEAQQAAIDMVRQRQSGQGSRIAADIKTNVAPRADVYNLQKALEEQRSSEATRLKDLALFEDVALPPPTPGARVVPNGVAEAPNAGVLRAVGQEPPVDEIFKREMVPVPEGVPVTGRQARIVNDPVLQQLARLPDAQKALQGAMERSEAERMLLATQGLPTDHIPDITPGADLDLRTFDYLRRYLKDEVDALYKRGESRSFAAGEAAQVKALHDTIRERLREFSPEYANYLEAYSGSSKMIDALEEGRQFRHLDPEEIAADQSGRSPAAQELYRIGAGRDMLDTVLSTKDNANPASRILNSPEARAQLEALGVDPAKAAALNKSVEQERIFNRLPEELAGAQTAQRAMAQADANAGADLHVPFNPGSPLGWLGMVGRTVLDRTSVARNALVNNELLPRMTETNPAVIEGIIAELEAQGKTQAAALMRRKILMNKAAGVGGVVIGAPTAIQGE